MLPPGEIISSDGKLNELDCDEHINVLLYNVETIEKREEHKFPKQTTGSGGKLNEWNCDEHINTVLYNVGQPREKRDQEEFPETEVPPPEQATDNDGKHSVCASCKYHH